MPTRRSLGHEPTTYFRPHASDDDRERALTAINEGGSVVDISAFFQTIPPPFAGGFASARPPAPIAPASAPRTVTVPLILGGTDHPAGTPLICIAWLYRISSASTSASAFSILLILSGFQTCQVWINQSSARLTCFPERFASTSIVKASRVQASVAVNKRNRRPEARTSLRKSSAHTDWEQTGRRWSHPHLRRYCTS